VAVYVSNKVLSLRSAFSYSAIESIGSRIFDFATLWIVLNTLNTEDIAKFGVATSAIFFFNLFFLAPETALFRYYKEWKGESKLNNYLSSYFKFSLLKLLVHYLGAFCVFLYFGADHWFLYAVIFSAITQQIQCAEISRIYLRLSLQQDTVAKFEIKSKLTLCALCVFLFYQSSITLYFGIYFLWSFTVALLWLQKIKSSCTLTNNSLHKVKKDVVHSLIGFSIWSHIAGVLTYFIYNSNLLFLNYYSSSVNEIALYTTVNKVANLFFVIPMFFQSFVPVVLASEEYASKKFNKLLLVCGFLSAGQFLFFVLFGHFLGRTFGVDDANISSFYELGLILSFGILLLNLTRPLSTYLLITASAKRVMAFVFVPSSIFALILYNIATSKFASLGAASASAIIYFYMALSLSIMFYQKKRKSHD
jgi:O-antigen/teichoic acid export membrane protein